MVVDMTEEKTIGFRILACVQLNQEQKVLYFSKRPCDPLEVGKNTESAA